MTDTITDSVQSFLQVCCEDASDRRHFGEFEGYLELVRPDGDDGLEPLGVAARTDPADGQTYLVLKVHLDPRVLDGDRVDAEDVIQAAVDSLVPFFGDEEEKFLVTDLECYGAPDDEGIIRLLGDEDLDGESPIPVELFAVQVSPATPLTELGNDSVRELVLTAPLELAAEIIEEPAIG